MSAPIAPASSAPTVVVVHAHPDDEAIFTGLLIRRLVDRGSRVVLVTATGGEHGLPEDDAGPTAVASLRLRELEDACELLGVARLVLLGRRDSGRPGTVASRHPRALGRSRPDPLAARVAQLAVREGAAAVLHDDPTGIYGHPDHLAVHRVGTLAARLAGVSGYEVTVDHARLAGSSHLVSRAADWLGTPAFGQPSARIGLGVHGTAREIATKRAAMAAHASQISTADLAQPAFDRLYGREWLTRVQGPAVLEPFADRLPGTPSVGVARPGHELPAPLAPVIPLHHLSRATRAHTTRRFTRV